MNKTAMHLALLAAASSVVLLTNLGGARLWDRDEPRNAGCAREMLSRGDWIVPWFNDEIRTHKPILLYWLIMSATSLFGDNEFAARIGSALLGIGTVLWTYVIGRRFFGPGAGLFAGLALSASLMFDLAGRAATPDSCLVHFVTAALGCFAWGLTDESKLNRGSSGLQRQRFRFWPMLGSYVFMSIAVLAKGPVGIVLPAAILVFIVAVEQSFERTMDEMSERGLVNRLRSIGHVLHPSNLWTAASRLRPLLGLATLLVVAAPWYLAASILSEGEFARGFFLDHNIARAMDSREGHAGAFWYYPMAMLVGFFPSSVFALPALVEFSRAIRGSMDRRTRQGLVFGFSWVLVWVVAFSIARTKLPSYMTPCYPALAVLTGWMLDRWCTKRAIVGDRWLVASFIALAAAGAGFSIAIPRLTAEHLPGEGWLAWFGSTLVVSGLAALAAIAMRSQRAAVSFHFVGSIAFCSCLFGLGTMAADRHQMSHLITNAVNAAGESAAVYSYGCLEPSWVYYLKRPIRELSLEDSEIPSSPIPFGYHARRHVQAIRDSAEPAFVITTRDKLAPLQDQLGEEFQPVLSLPLFLKKEQLVLVARDPQSKTVASRGGLHTN